ncbi:hypothetical protein HBZS_110160 [Helicobacter bizzozeronii CCUG 35545]|nr:hypothetical protein HBZS_110160 [Helicobacter bizzozeronii CCUG 35545]
MFGVDFFNSVPVANNAKPLKLATLKPPCVSPLTHTSTGLIHLTH